MENNYKGGAFSAPPWQLIAEPNPDLWNTNVSQADPLLVIGVGDFGESLLVRFRAFTKFHRSGFCWSKNDLFGLIVPSNPEVCKQDGTFFKYSMNKIRDLRDLADFLRNGNPKCVVAFDVSEQTSYDIVIELLTYLDDLRDLRNGYFPVDLVALVNEGKDEGLQSARIRTISLWQQNGRHNLENTRQITLIDNAYLVKQEINSEETINKSVLCLFSLYYSGQPMGQLFQVTSTNWKIFAVNIRAIYVPYDRLVQYKTIKLAREILYESKIQLPVNKQLLDTAYLNSVRGEQEFANSWHSFNKSTCNEKVTHLTKIINSQNEFQKWEKMYLFSLWSGEYFKEINGFIKKVPDCQEVITKKLDDYEHEALQSLTGIRNNSVMRWVVDGDVRSQADSIVSSFVTEGQIDSIKREITKRISFEIESGSNGQPKFSLICEPGKAQPRFWIDGNSTHKDYISFLNNLLSLIARQLETALVQYLNGTPNSSLIINDTAAEFLTGIPEAIPGNENDKKIFFSSEIYRQTGSLDHRLKNLQQGKIQESGLALAVLVESDVNYKSFPNHILYLKNNIEDKRLRSVFDLERKWDNTLLHEFSPKTLLYMGNYRAVKLFSHAVIAGLIKFDLTKGGWVAEGLAEMGPVKLGDNKRQESNLTSLLQAFRYFTLDGIVNVLGFTPFSNPEQHSKFLDRLETELTKSNHALLPENWIDTLPTETQYVLNQQQRVEQADLVYLFKSIIKNCD